MATPLDLAANLTGASVTEAQAKTWFTAMRAALAEMGDPLGQSGAIQNLSMSFSVASNALTANVKTRAGLTPSATDPATVAIRNATLATADFTSINITGALSTVISSGSTGGHQSAVQGVLYWYIISNAGAPELSWSSSYFGSQGIVSTTAEGGAGAADSANVMYSTTARSNVPFRCIGRTYDTQTVAGTWAAAPTEGDLAPFDLSVDIQTFTGSGTWVKPPLAKTVKVICIGAGGGGGGARGGAAASIRKAGTGGGGGSTSSAEFNAADLSATESITVGAAGSSGAGGTSADGSDGGVGGTTSFGSRLSAYGGGGGCHGDNSGAGLSGGSGGGTGGAGLTGSGSDLRGGLPNSGNVTAVGGVGGGGGGTGTSGVAQGGEYGGGGGGGGSGANGSAGCGSIYGGAGGGAGGAVDAGNVERTGGAGGVGGAYITGSGGTAGTTNGGAGGAGGAGTGIIMGSGGGGGGGQDSGTGGAGGAGGAPGGGGGGGGGGTSTGGAGGLGGRGEVRVYSFF